MLLGVHSKNENSVKSSVVWDSLCSVKRLSLLEVLDGLEHAVTGVLNHFLGLPIGGEDGSISDSDSWHLKGEQIHVWLDGGLAHGVGLSIVDAAVAEESARKAAKDDDFILGDLHDAGALALSKLRSWHVDDDP